LLRIPDSRDKALEYNKFVADLAHVRKLLTTEPPRS
jgi:hypothetical protein